VYIMHERYKENMYLLLIDSESAYRENSLYKEDYFHPCL